MQNIIKVNGLEKTFKVHHRDNTGILSAFASMFKRRYKIIRAVNNIGFNVSRGSIHGFIGPNGSGKSTTIKILSGILHPSHGDVEVLGYIPWKQRKEYVKNIGVLFGQKSQLGWEIPALDTYKVHKEIYKIPENKFNETLDYLIHGFQIENIVTKPVRTLSLGERMRCEIVCVLLHDPEIVFLDEPTIGLDIIAKDIFRNLIKKMNKEKGTTFLLTTHDLNEIDSICHSTTVINRGNIVFNGSLVELKKNFLNKKIIELTFTGPLPEKDIKEFQIEMQGPLLGKIKLDLSERNIQDEISRLYQRLPINGLNVQALNIESIIKLLYT